MLVAQTLLVCSLLVLATRPALGRPSVGVEERWKRAEVASVNHLEKRKACTTIADCTSVLVPNSHRECVNSLCRTACDTGYYFDTNSLCKLYTCVVSKCTNVLPANAKRVCTSKNLCSFQCLSGYVLNAAGTGCVRTTTSLLATSARSTTTTSRTTTTTSRTTAKTLRTTASTTNSLSASASAALCASKCTQTIPAHSSRSCTSAGVCSFVCVAGYVLGPEGRGCAPTTTSKTSSSTSSSNTKGTISTSSTSTSLPTQIASTPTTPTSSSSTTSSSTTSSTSTLASSLTSSSTTSSLTLTSSSTTVLTTATSTATSSASATPTVPFSPIASFAESVRYADGSEMMYGEVNSKLRWQASGILAIGSCSKTVVGLGTCFRQYLNSTGMLQDPLPVSTTTTLISGTATATATSSEAAPTPTDDGTGTLDNFFSENSLFRVVELSLQEQAARDDENLELYWRAFPEAFGGLRKRATCGTATTTSSTSSATATSTSSASSTDGSTSDSTSLGSTSSPTSVETTTTSTTSTTTTTSPPVVTSHVPASPRQRIEFLSWPGAAAGTSWTYTWTTYLTPGVKTSEHFFHMWQLFSRDPCVNGPIFTLSAYLGNIRLNDSVGRCSSSTIPCPSIPIASYWGRTVVHSLAVTYGVNGTMTYTAVDRLDPAVSLLSHSAVGQMGSASSLKFGLYRAASGNYISEAEIFVGGYTAVKIA